MKNEDTNVLDKSRLFKLGTAGEGTNIMAVKATLVRHMGGLP